MGSLNQLFIRPGGNAVGNERARNKQTEINLSSEFANIKTNQDKHLENRCGSSWGWVWGWGRIFRYIFGAMWCSYKYSHATNNRTRCSAGRECLVFFVNWIFFFFLDAIASNLYHLNVPSFIDLEKYLCTFISTLSGDSLCAFPLFLCNRYTILSHFHAWLVERVENFDCFKDELNRSVDWL